MISKVFSRGLIFNVKLRYKKKERGVEKVSRSLIIGNIQCTGYGWEKAGCVADRSRPVS